MMLNKYDLKPKKSTLIKLRNQHRKDAVKEDNLVLKQMYWEMAFDYSNMIRIFYGTENKEEE